LTLIATGFDNATGVNSANREKEITQQLKNLKGNELDTPSFLRQRTTAQARPIPMITPLYQPNKVVRK